MIAKKSVRRVTAKYCEMEHDTLTVFKLVFINKTRLLLNLVLKNWANSHPSNVMGEERQKRFIFPISGQPRSYM